VKRGTFLFLSFLLSFLAEKELTWNTRYPPGWQLNRTLNPVPPDPQPHLETQMCLLRTLALDLSPAPAYRSSIKTKGLKLNEKWPFGR
jgi:hypothetical protein